MLADRIIPIISYTEEASASFSSEKKKIPNTIGIFRYNSKSKKGSFECKYCNHKNNNLTML